MNCKTATHDQKQEVVHLPLTQKGLDSAVRSSRGRDGVGLAGQDRFRTHYWRRVIGRRRQHRTEGGRAGRQKNNSANPAKTER